MKLWKHHRGKLLLGLLIFVFLFVNLPQTKALYKSVLFIVEVLPGSQVKPLSLITKKPVLKEVTYKSGNKEIFADLYLPNDNKNHPAAVLHLGLDIDRKDPRVALLAEALARSGMIVLAPNLPTISSRRLTFETPTEFKDSFSYLSSLPMVDKNKTGFIAICAAGAPAIAGSSDPSIRDKVNFFVTINPYYNLSQLYKDLTIRKIDGKDWTPHFKSVEVYNRETVNLIENDYDKEALSKILVSIDPNKLSKGDFAKVDPYKTFNSNDAVNTYLGLTNKNPEMADDYLENISQKQKEYRDKLSASTFVKDFKPKTFILSEKSNPYILYTHAEMLHRNLKNSVFEEVDFTITESGAKISAKDGWGYFIFLWKILNYLNI